MVHHFNKEAAQHHHHGENNVDVLFLGDSLTEGWLGTSYGRRHAVVHNVPQVFKSMFSVQDGGLYEGLALGISGDTAPNLLWRIQNGEIPPNLHPPVIWVLIGTNDFGSTWCSAEMVLIGILRVVEELRLLRPDSTVVIHGLLPRTYNRGGYVGRGRQRRTWWWWWWWRFALSSLFGKSRLLPPPATMPSMWDDFEAVNEELKNYAANRERVEYFETEVFLVDPRVPDDMKQINGKLMPDFFHPSAEGYRLWGLEIVEKLKVLLPNR
jgi:lysophospholipase L1-like esterase